MKVLSLLTAPNARMRPKARFVALGAMALALSGCGHMMHERPGEPRASNGNQVLGSKGAKEFKANGAILFGPAGELQVVDAQGNPVQACVAPSTPADKRKAIGDLPVCEKLKNTSVRRIDSISVLEHTGSTCTAVTLNGYTYIICY